MLQRHPCLELVQHLIAYAMRLGSGPFRGRHLCCRISLAHRRANDTMGRRAARKSSCYTTPRKKKNVSNMLHSLDGLQGKQGRSCINCSSFLSVPCTSSESRKKCGLTDTLHASQLLLYPGNDVQESPRIRGLACGGQHGAEGFTQLSAHRDIHHKIVCLNRRFLQVFCLYHMLVRRGVGGPPSVITAASLVSNGSSVCNSITALAASAALAVWGPVRGVWLSETARSFAEAPRCLFVPPASASQAVCAAHAGDSNPLLSRSSRHNSIECRDGVLLLLRERRRRSSHFGCEVANLRYNEGKRLTLPQSHGGTAWSVTPPFATVAPTRGSPPQ
ncbi:hypothetical protein TraAM80_06359 [Trypanosoma rangeli]|uniref:Uncharacterized protein n=1 Tax=Trypanosoma rangeli TaxID=5698 RepID=A0A422NAH5_TRYRA|nr:uncharacterized protein TraAM80_06359 [Trypanosoma rangeli]RNF02453.1 hypothetical protein TraAM80_06359 [Trypanosoma rangeli]|eukprot:RNF02453.1 hypothetical protein TraAM80_06359 [Trypanosoma rangeli]